MKTVRIVLVLAVALVIAAPVIAQERKKRKPGANKLTGTSMVMMRMGRLHKALEELDLTAEQKEKLGKIREEAGPKLGKIFEKIKDILTEEQNTAAQEAAKKAQEAGKEGRAFFAAVEGAVKLTDDQKKKMTKIDEEILPLHRAAVKRIIGILTPEQRENVRKKMAPRGPRKGEKKEKKAE